MEYTDILYEVDGPAAVITLNRPDKLNAWTGRMEREYKDALRAELPGVHPSETRRFAAAVRSAS